MRTKTGWLVGILTTGLALAPRPGWSQGIGPADSPILPLPLYHDRPEKGGFYSAYEYIYWRMTNPMKQQSVAVRGLVDVDGSLQVARNQLRPFLVDPDSGVTLTRPAIDPNTGQLVRNPDGTIRQFPIPAPTPVPGAFFGSGATALDAEQVAGPVSYQPGFGIALGRRFSDGFTLEFNWRHLAEVRYSAVASVVPPSYHIGRDGEDQFLFSPVFNFPPEFSGPVNKLSVADPTASGSSASLSVTPFPINNIVVAGIGPVSLPTGFTAFAQANTSGSVTTPQAAYGIWNAATVMSIDFVQRHDQYDLIGRMPMYQNDCSRWYGLCGLRHVAIWERFKWRTISVATSNAGATASVTLPTITTSSFTNTANGGITVGSATSTGGSVSVGASATGGSPAFAGADDVAVYTNIVSNRMYGPVVGCGSEWYLGWGLALSLDLRAAVHVDVVKERARYEREDKYIASKRSRTQVVVVPELDAFANVWWYPFEGIEVRFGYDFMNFFNTVSAPRPVDFDYGALAPAWEKGTYRFIEGFHAGIGLIF